LDDVTTAPKRGRPFTTKNATLEGLRDAFVWVLENDWGVVGYELTQSTTILQIRSALAPFNTGIYADRFKIFLRPSATYATTLAMRKTRLQQGEVIEQLQAAFNEEQVARQSVERIEQALRQASGTTDQHAMENEHVRRTASLLVVQKHRADLDTRNRNLTEKLADDESGFAQTELLDFILEHRYSFTPLNFSNAMAGLPLMGWRQSSKRCVRWPCELANGLAYRQFKVIAACLRSDVKSHPLVERMRLFLQRKTKRGDNAVTELKKKWYYLCRATEQVEREDHPPESLPFRIMAEFKRRQNSANAVDRIREEEEQLW